MSKQCCLKEICYNMVLCLKQSVILKKFVITGFYILSRVLKKFIIRGFCVLGGVLS